MRAVAAEFIGAVFLLATVVGSGIMAERLTSDVALMLLCNSIATGGILFVLIAALVPVSGAHFNPAVSLAFLLDRSLGFRTFSTYVPAQVIGAVIGVWLAHAMFDTSILAVGVKARAGLGQMLSEGVATFGLVFTIFALRARARETIAAAVALYILAAYWFTASTSFANPAVTLARALTQSFAGIRALDVPAFLLAQIIGAVAATAVSRWLFPMKATERDRA